MKAEKFLFTILPTIATIVGLCSFYFGLYFLTVIASIFCLPVIFYRFVVETNFLFTFSVLPLTIIGAYVHESWYGGATLWFLSWTLVSLLHSYTKYAPIEKQHKRDITAYKQSPELKQAIEKEKAAYNFDLSGLSCKSAGLKFKKAKETITEPVTKFGGQPIWIEEPQWPISKSTGKPMKFIGQIAIDESLFGISKARIAYIFYAGDETKSWDMDSGDNAVILQPGTPEQITKPLTEGPSLLCSNQKPCEYSALLHHHEDSQFIPEYEQRTWTDKESDKYQKSNFKTKLGGTPYFVQGDEFPKPGKWQLLLQLLGSDLPLEVDFQLGCAYVFISSNGEKAKFLWQY